MIGEKEIRESGFISMLREAFPGSRLGYDAAVLRPPEGDALFASDAVVEGVHFDSAISTLGQAVEKAVTSNVSDIYAMGGEPVSAVFTAGLAPGCAAADAESIIGGLSRACGVYGLSLSGGDTVLSPGGYFFNIAIIGRAEPSSAVLRSGAREGDILVLCGDIGGSMAGMRILSLAAGKGAVGDPLDALLPARGDDRARSLKAAGSLSTAGGDGDMLRALEDQGLSDEYMPALALSARHLVPFAEAPGWPAGGPRRAGVTAMIDISDGLSRDLRSLCAESGAGAVVLAGALPAHPSLEVLSGSAALTGLLVSSGEEYRLLAAAADGSGLPKGCAVIGRIAPEHEGILLEGEDGERAGMPVSGYEHGFGGD